MSYSSSTPPSSQILFNYHVQNSSYESIHLIFTRALWDRWYHYFPFSGEKTEALGTDDLHKTPWILGGKVGMQTPSRIYRLDHWAILFPVIASWCCGRMGIQFTFHNKHHTVRARELLDKQLDPPGPFSLSKYTLQFWQDSIVCGLIILYKPGKVGRVRLG